MEQFHTSALALQKHLLNLRQEMIALDAQGKKKQAAHLARLIAHIEQTLSRAPAPLKPTTLQ